MSTNDDKYLVLRGKNKDIYFIQKRVSRDISNIIGKEFIKKSLETTDIVIARQKRDKILQELEEIASNASTDQENTSKIEDFEDIINVPMNKKPKNTYELSNIDHEINLKKKKFNIFSLKLPNREELIVNIDKFIPIGIVILTLFITFVV
tara:strand:- start:948 stop:1397 length:450 start_codon:yes stop_codon:yes gene_type:complete